MLQTIDEMEKLGQSSEGQMKTDIQQTVRELREIYEARFAETDELVFADIEEPVYAKSAQAIIETLGGDNE